MEIATATNGWVNTANSQNADVIRQAQGIIANNIYCTLSTCSVDGIPWVSPLFFAFDDNLNIYWSSAIASQHSQNLYSNNGRAAISIFNTTFPEGSPEGLYFSGVASELDGDDTEFGLQLLKPRARNPINRTAVDYLNDSPRRMYRFEPKEAWVTGERISVSNQLVDTRVCLSLIDLKI
ncbi:pyridoxamine 5'-phosphate oxidase family protein [Merismopedia glauca]|uniref:Pyridoxamine 5'-phosphate oxidase n=1 Tax=Merismopedia glauca CCAP 1448/3 TaxID=1296344 RepID=A0A2T1BZD3_9CYAN|nr:pyridoxamine 5'-phosphate oxidase family protein [Merismopedia glauca]PSB01352.1 pyridoxamine 5'-phosphate oxidase [Merismopedia glauca CCAP 1448/3]